MWSHFALTVLLGVHPLCYTVNKFESIYKGTCYYKSEHLKCKDSVLDHFLLLYNWIPETGQFVKKRSLVSSWFLMLEVQHKEPSSGWRGS